jgi:hypothetical protein
MPVALDQFYLEHHPGGPDETWATWCENHAEKSACVLIVCSEGWFDSYRKGGVTGEGLGVALEAAVFSQKIYDDKGHNARARLVILNDFNEDGIPPRLKGWHIFRPFSGDAEFNQMTMWIRQRLSMPGSSGSPPKVVFLAECKFDMQQERKKLQSFLEDRNWQVRPASEYPPVGREDAFRADLVESVAFIQLLESYPRESGFDRQQREAAKHKPRFLFRHEKIALDQADEKHREFLTPRDVINCSFDDFQAYVAVKLDRLWEKQKPAPVKTSESRKVLVRVVVRSPKRDRLWDKVFKMIDSEPDLRPHLLEEDEKFIDKHYINEPCHGLLIVCDGSAIRDHRHSLKRDLEECSLIQYKDKDKEEPPVGLVYWRPPRLTSWSPLLHIQPRRLHRILGDTPDALPQFFEDVRRLAK